jgi:hypothetical protein
LQLPLQQSVPAPHDAPLALQHFCAVPQLRPLQQSPAILHAAPSAEHPHFVVAVLQIPAPAQQSPVTPHVAPAAAQPHVLSDVQKGAKVPVQQSPARVHEVPSAPQPHLPVERSQTWPQHCESAVHAAVSG